MHHPAAPSPLDPHRTFIVTREVDAIRRCKQGRFGFVVGLSGSSSRGAARGAAVTATPGEARRALREAGADLVVAVLADLTVDEIDAWFANREHARPPLPAHRDAITRRLAGRTPAIFLDYDGTLTPIVERPELAILAPEMRRTLSDLAAKAHTVIVSGRGRAEVARLVGVEELIYAGSHGFDIAGPRASTGRGTPAGPGDSPLPGNSPIRHEVAGDLRPAVRQAAIDLATALAGVPGVLVEDKRFSVAVHYRQVADDRVAEIESAVDRVLAGHLSDRDTGALKKANASGKSGAGEKMPTLKKTRGKKVLELRPAVEWDKGQAVLWLLRALGLEGEEIVPIYVGDDTTDEDAFRALHDRGLTALVARTPRPTAAGYSLQDTDEVGDFLRLIAALDRPGMKLA
jgi:trehalose-phosphatase